MASNQQSVNTSAGAPYVVPMGSTGYLDTPADKRLLPWVVLGSIMLGIIAAGMVITTFTSFGTIHHLWGIFAGGVVLGIAAILGVLTAIIRRPAVAALWFAVTILAWLGAVAAMIVNACFLHHYMDRQCGTGTHCREYYTSVYTAWGALVAAWVPVMILVSGFYWKTSRLHRAANHNANTVNAASGLPPSNSRFGIFKKNKGNVPVGYAGH